jgi:phosphoserine phosphatase RsbX
MIDEGRFGPIEWARAFRPAAGESVCGDQGVAVDMAGAALFGVIDGLGHGAMAATAATRAVDVIVGARTEPVDTLFKRCHRELANTRGAAMTLVRIGFADETLEWMGVGNVTADLFIKGLGGVQKRSSARLAGGIVGYRMPEIYSPERTAIRPGALLVVASDGISERYSENIDFTASAYDIADHIIKGHSKAIDDALVLVARHRGVMS